MPSCCVVYTPDRGYLFNSLVSAVQARRHTSVDLADVVLFCFGVDPATECLFAHICEQERILFQPVKMNVIHGASAMMSRLFLNDFAPAKYTQYLYVDGDVQILGSLDPLVAADVPRGKFMAANDPLTFQIDDDAAQSRQLLGHLTGIGLTHRQIRNYFNSGVLRINRAGWEGIGWRAWELFSSSSVAGFPDQDALNLVASEQRIPMSLGWNFPVFMRNARVETEIQPRIVHFMSNPKPWQGQFPPWTGQACSPYAEMVRRYPQLAPFATRLPFFMSTYYHLQQRRKRLIESRTWGSSERRNRILDYERVCSKASIDLCPI